MNSTVCNGEPYFLLRRTFERVVLTTLGVALFIAAIFRYGGIADTSFEWFRVAVGFTLMFGGIGISAASIVLSAFIVASRNGGARVGLGLLFPPLLFSGFPLAGALAIAGLIIGMVGGYLLPRFS